MIAGMPRLVVISTGGTIATSAGADGVLRPSRSGADLTAGLDVETIDLLSKDSSQLEPADWLRIGAAVNAAAAGGAEGIVVTHGTDSLEETALWLELTYGGSPPVVLTGAALPADDPNADGPRNLRDACVVASSPVAWESGALVCFAGSVFAPLGTTKVGGAAVFGGTSALGSIAGERFTMTGTKDRAHIGAVPSPARVDIVAAYPGADGAAIDAFVAAGAKAVVVEAMGSGNAGTPIADAVRRACERNVSVAVTTRVPGGHTHAGYGPGHDLVEAGAVMVPRLRSSQARVLLMAALGAGLAVSEVISRWG